MPYTIKKSSKKNGSEKQVTTSKRKPLKAKIIASDKPGNVIHLRSVTITSEHVPKSRPYLKESHVPFLRLRGKWLEEAGFPIDSKVDIIVDNNLLIIKPAGVV